MRSLNVAKQFVINVDLADVYEQASRKGFLHTLAGGDHVEVFETTKPVASWPVSTSGRN